MSSIASGTTTTTGLVYTADTTGNLVLQTNGTTTAVTIDTAQNVGVGVTPSSWSGFTVLQDKSASMAVTSNGNNVDYSINRYNNGTNDIFYQTGNYALIYEQASGSGAHRWYTSTGTGTAGGTISFTQAMTLDNSGNLLVGTTTTSGSNVNSFMALPQSSGCFTVTQHASGSASGFPYAYFNYNGSTIGSITQNGTTGVLYNLTSDYRLKNNPVPVTGAKDFVMALQPKTWDWWDGSGKGVGFIAHEFMEVAKYSGHGDKDATKEEEYEIIPAVKDEQGNITTPAVMGTKTVPVYQSIQPSSSEVMANLVAYIQELSAEVTDLKAKLAITSELDG